ncbi:hypothetical protein [Bacteroides sp.]|uniref:hypothetical protein n=1 Tax=Bacteroides sp. TaxID=29523 RepID=UPI00261FA4B6|nr:hypothetical protein [Bacteroides sp.]
MNKKLFSLFAMLFIACLSFTSCSSDDDGSNDGDGNSSIVTVNTNKFKVENDATATYNANNSTLVFESYLIQEDVEFMSMYDFAVRIAGISFNDLKKDAELDVEVRDYRDYTDVGSLYEFTVVSGKVIVSSISDNNVTLKFDKFKFNRDNRSFEVNGYINYRKN